MDKDYKKSLYQSLSLHGLLLVVMLGSSFFGGPKIIRIGGNNGDQQNKPVIQAGLINPAAVKNAINRQEQIERNKQKQLALEKSETEKMKKAAEQAKLEAEKLKKEIAAAQKKAEQTKKLALAERESAEKAKLQAAKEKEQAAQKLEKIKQAKLQQEAKEKAAAKQAQEKATLARKKALEEQAKQKAAQAAAARQAHELALQQQAAAAAAERASWLDNEFSRYVAEIERRIRENRTISSAFPPDLKCDIQIKLLPDGSIHEVRIIKSSGNVAYDSMSEAAVYKAAPFEMPEDNELMSRLRDIIVGLIAGEGGNV